MLALALGVPSACAQEERVGDGWAAVEVQTFPAGPAGVGAGAHPEAGSKTGPLVFAGGLELRSRSVEFGGFSGLHVGADGRLLAVSDGGKWFSARLVLDRDGALIGLSNPKMAWISDAEGAPLHRSIGQDAEALARLPDGRYAVSFERYHRIALYDLDARGPRAPAEEGPAIPVALPGNEGLESLALGPDGGLVAATEFDPFGNEGARVYRLPLAAGQSAGEGIGHTRAGYALVDLARMPDGDYLGLERFYFPLIGFRTVLRRYPGQGVRATPPVLKGEVLGELKPPELTDNFEGIAITPGPPTGLRIYLISDNNFKSNQRTLLYAFDLPAPPAPAAEAIGDPKPLP